MNSPAPDDVFEALVAAFPSRYPSDPVSVRRSGDEAILMFRWRPHPQLFGVPVSLTATHRRLDWDEPAEDLDDWIDSLSLWIMEDVENGFLYRARRRRVDDYIELRGPAWPMDERFYVDVVDPKDDDSWLRTPFVRDDGLDPGVAVEHRDSGDLLAWVTAYENNSTGTPYVAQAVVVRDGAQVARIEHVETVDDLPTTLHLDLVRTATHVAADAGALSVVTGLDLPHLEIAGFRRSCGGALTVDTSFLDEDADAAQRLHEEQLAHPALWGRDRDAAGRYLPGSRFGRLLHRVRHGRSGASPRVFAG